MKGYKAFNPDMTCLGMQYEVGKTYRLECDCGQRHLVKPIICSRGFHYCKEPIFVNNYYDWVNDKNIKIAEIEATGDIDRGENDKFCTNEIRIVRMITREEMMQLCTGTFTDNAGSVYRFRNAVLHHNKKPAVEHCLKDCETGNYYKVHLYYRNGRMHRIGGFAREEFRDNPINQYWLNNRQVNRRIVASVTRKIRNARC